MVRIISYTLVKGLKSVTFKFYRQVKNTDKILKKLEEKHNCWEKNNLGEEEQVSRIYFTYREAINKITH